MFNGCFWFPKIGEMVIYKSPILKEPETTIDICYLHLGVSKNKSYPKMDFVYSWKTLFFSMGFFFWGFQPQLFLATPKQLGVLGDAFPVSHLVPQMLPWPFLMLPLSDCGEPMDLKAPNLLGHFCDKLCVLKTRKFL